MLGTHTPHSPGYSPLKRRNSGGVSQKTVARRTILISFILLCVSGTLNIAFLFSRLIPSTTDKGQLVDPHAQPVVVPQCPSINCNTVCARHAYQAERAAARQAACDVDGTAAGGSSRQHAQAREQLPDILLFVGALSGRGYRHRRLAVRDAWATQCQTPGVSVCRFIMSHDEVSPLVEEEVQEYQDIVLVHGETTYKSILLKSLFVFEYALRHYDVRFVLKTDDDAFVNVPYLTAQLRMLCGSPDCRQERLYMGNLCLDGEVFTQPGHKWNNAVRALPAGRQLPLACIHAAVHFRASRRTLQLQLGRRMWGCRAAPLLVCTGEAMRGPQHQAILAHACMHAWACAAIREPHGPEDVRKLHAGRRLHHERGCGARAAGGQGQREAQIHAHRGRHHRHVAHAHGHPPRAPPQVHAVTRRLP